MTNEERDQVLRRVAAALTQVTHPETGEDVVSSGRVRELGMTDDGIVRFRFALQADDPGTLVRLSRAAAERVEGVSKVKIDISLPAVGKPQTKRQMGPGNVPAPTPNPTRSPACGTSWPSARGRAGWGRAPWR